MKKRSHANIIQCLLLLAVLWLLIGGSPATAAQASQGSGTMEKSMNLAQKIESPAIPPIDAEAPANFETASFGLG